VTQDSILFLAATTIFGLAMLLVGWQVRAWQEQRRYDRLWTSIKPRYVPDDTDELSGV
jgi:hypothetical protein